MFFCSWLFSIPVLSHASIKLCQLNSIIVVTVSRTQGGRGTRGRGNTGITIRPTLPASYWHTYGLKEMVILNYLVFLCGLLPV